MNENIVTTKITTFINIASDKLIHSLFYLLFKLFNILSFRHTNFLRKFLNELMIHYLTLSTSGGMFGSEHFLTKITFVKCGSNFSNE